MATSLFRNTLLRRVFCITAAINAAAFVTFPVHASASGVTPASDSSGGVSVVVGTNRHYADSTIAEVTLRDHTGKTCLGLSFDSRSPMDPYLVSLWRDTVLPMLGVPSDFDSCIATEHRSTRAVSYAVGFVLDHSPSMTTPRAIRMQRAVHAAIRRMQPSDAITVIKFTAAVRVEVPLMTDKPTALELFKINGINNQHDGTAIYDAVLRGLTELERAATGQRPVLMVFTDGEDNASSVSLDSVIHVARRRNTMVHVISYGVSDTREVARLARATGGTMHELVDIYALDAVFLTKYQQLHTTHTVRVWHAPRHPMEHAGAITSLGGAKASERTILSILPLLPTEGIEILQGRSDAHSLVISMKKVTVQEASTDELRNEGLTGLGWMMRRESDVMIEVLRPMESNTGWDAFEDVRRVLMKAGVAAHRVVRGATIEQSLGHVEGFKDGVLMIIYRQ